MAELRHTVEVRPAFYDVDPLGIVWHGHYVKFFELARSALMERFDYGYEAMRASGYAWPIVDLRVKFAKPAALNQRLSVEATIVEYEHRLKVDYVIRDVTSGVRLTRGSTVQVAVDVKTNELQYVCPRVLFEKLGLP